MRASTSKSWFFAPSKLAAGMRRDGMAVYLQIQPLLVTLSPWSDNYAGSPSLTARQSAIMTTDHGKPKPTRRLLHLG